MGGGGGSLQKLNSIHVSLGMTVTRVTQGSSVLFSPAEGAALDSWPHQEAGNAGKDRTRVSSSKDSVGEPEGVKGSIGVLLWGQPNTGCIRLQMWHCDMGAPSPRATPSPGDVRWTAA